MATQRTRKDHTVNATEAKNRFGAILKAVKKSQPVYIERHGTAQAVVLDIASYQALLHRARKTEDIELDALRQEFDALYAQMQTAKSRKAIDRLTRASSEELTAVAGANAKPRR